MTKIPNLKNSRWRLAAILKIVLSLYLSRKSSDFNEILCADANFGSNNSHVAKYQNFANPIWRPAGILKIVFLGISQRFIVRLTRNLARRNKITLDTGHVTKIAKFRKFKMADGHHFENGFIAISQSRIIHFQ